MRFGEIPQVVGVAGGRVRATLLLFAVVGALLAVGAACGGSAEKATSAVAALGSHKAGAAHDLQPKRLEAVVEVDMGDYHFANSQGQENPTFRIPAGKTVGIHIHNEGDIVHEMAIGRNIKDGEYSEVLTELVPSDLFFYYGEVKAEIEGAKFGEIEVDKGIRDTWIRLNIPAQLKGEWELGCFVEGHFEKGMHAKLIVE